MQNHVRSKICGKQKFVGGAMTKLWPNLHVASCCEKHGIEMKIKDLNLAEEDDFPCKLR